MYTASTSTMDKYLLESLVSRESHNITKKLGFRFARVDNWVHQISLPFLRTGSSVTSTRARRRKQHGEKPRARIVVRIEIGSKKEWKKAFHTYIYTHTQIYVHIYIGSKRKIKSKTRFNTFIDDPDFPPVLSPGSCASARICAKFCSPRTLYLIVHSELRSCLPLFRCACGRTRVCPRSDCKGNVGVESLTVITRKKKNYRICVGEHGSTYCRRT
jgi:hypothetical protein